MSSTGAGATPSFRCPEGRSVRGASPGGAQRRRALPDGLDRPPHRPLRRHARSAASTSQEIAARAGLNERYVREWLGAMVTSGVVDVDPQSLRYQLPPEHAAYLTRAAGRTTWRSSPSTFRSSAASRTTSSSASSKGGGVPYEQFPRFHAVMAEDSGQSVLSSLESHILPLVPGLPSNSSAACDGSMPAAAAVAS